MSSGSPSSGSLASGYLRVAHRGAPAEAPENTIASFRRALRHPVDGVELDVRISRDGHPVVLHDADLARTGGRPERAADLDRDTLLRVDVGSWFAPGFAGERIPDLAAALGAIGPDRRALVELKDPDIGAGAADRVAAALDARAARNTATLVSFHPAVLREVQRRIPHLRTGLLIADPDEVDPVGAAADAGASLLLLPHACVDDDVVGFCARGGYPVVAWTVDEVAEMERLLECGVIGIVSNRPERFAAMPT